jgi:hypothetical protein
MILDDAVVLEWEEAKNEIEKLAAVCDERDQDVFWAALTECQKRMEKIQAQKDCEIHANKREDTLPVFVASTINGPKQDCKPEQQPSQQALDNIAQFHHVLICVACQYQDVERLRGCSRYLKQVKTLRILKEKVMEGRDGRGTRQSCVKCSPDAHPLPPLYITPAGVRAGDQGERPGDRGDRRVTVVTSG